METNMRERQDERFKADTPLRFAARIVLTDLSAAGKVAVLDISRNGAKVDVGLWGELPRELYLMLPGPGGRDKIRLVCEKRWQVGSKIGVRFERSLCDTILAGLIGSPQPLESGGAPSRWRSTVQDFRPMRMAVGA